MATETQTLIKRLFEAGAHFGFSKARRHPTVTPYLYGNKQGTDIFDLEKTGELMVEAAAYLKELGTGGKQVLFVGTKEEIAALVRAKAEELNMPQVTTRWIGGTLTNFPEIKKRIDRLSMLRGQEESGELERKYVKKEHLMLTREVEKLSHYFGGIVNLDRKPAALLVVDPRHETIAVKEARDMNVPVIAIMSSDCDLSLVTKPVIVNDALKASVSLALEELTAAYTEGRSAYVPPKPKTDESKEAHTRATTDK